MKVRLVFDGRCPGCGLELERVLCSESSEIFDTESVFINPKFDGAGLPASWVEGSGGRNSTRDSRPNISTGIESIDGRLRFGQLVVLQGPASHALSLFLCVRAMLPEPLGSDSDVVFLDGGNLFDAYAISLHAMSHGIVPEKVHERIHISRAFTYHQVSSMITQKLSLTIDRFQARLAVVSDITQLYCDPDVRNRRDAKDTFARDVRFLAELAERRNLLVVATVLKTRDRILDNLLLRVAHSLVEFPESAGLTELSTGPFWR